MENQTVTMRQSPEDFFMTKKAVQTQEPVQVAAVPPQQAYYYPSPFEPLNINALAVVGIIGLIGLFAFLAFMSSDKKCRT